MATDISDLLAVAAAPTVTAVTGTRDDQLRLPTPCTEFQLRDLLNHLFHVVVTFRSLAGRGPADWSRTPDYLAGDWRTRFGAEAAGLVTAWSSPAALEGVSPGMNGLPQPLLGQMVLLDLVVHGWDVARATGHPYAADPAAVAVSQRLALAMGDQARESGVFAATVAAGDTTGGDLATLLGQTGRDPAWTPLP